MKKPSLNDVVAVLSDILQEDIPAWDLDTGYYGEVCNDAELAELDPDESVEFAQRAVAMAIKIIKMCDQDRKVMDI